MTDREMLEFAAKAFGGVSYVDGMGWIHEDELGSRGAWWNPLTDDGDALRLAVNLHMQVSITTNSCRAETIPSLGVRESHDDERTATRRAITRAAAEIGKRMP